jgi:2-isopropylmalate synthase
MIRKEILMGMETIKIFDTTLRDGEQAPGASMSIQEKLEVAHQLERLKVDVIEAGFPVSSPAQFEATKRICGELTGPTIAGLARANYKDIDAASEALKDAKHSRIHTFIATSPVHMQYKLRKKPAEVLEMAVKAVEYARKCADEVEFSPEDACRTELPFLFEILEAVIEAGAAILNIPDTVGYILPHEYAKIISGIRENVKGIDKAVISTHCHNDLGLATANSLAGVLSGARQVECTINGIGERAGNSAMEEIVMAINTRPDCFENITTNIEKTEISRASRLVSNMTGFAIAPNKAIVGANAFAHESGIHVDGVLKHRETYEIMTPETIGLSGSRMVLGRHSGRHGFVDRCSQLGYNLNEDEIQIAYERFLSIADKKKEVFDEDIAAIINDEVRHVEKIYELEYLHVASGTGTLPTASVRMKFEGKTAQAAACGDGPIDAAYQAIREAINEDPKLISYNIRAVTGGKEAMGEATVRIENEKGRSFLGRGASTDIVEASAKAYVDAINRMRSGTIKGSGTE